MGLRIPDGWRIEKLGDVTSYAQEKVDNSQIDTTRYISTDNMIPNRGGILVSSKKPNESKINSYLKGDILVSNIRPYFKKIWMAKFSGGCSNDVLVIRSNSNVNADFIYYYLSQEDFFDYTVRTSKGTKMPRGDKEAIMNFLVNVPPLSEQQSIAKILSDLDEKIELNNEMNKTLEEIAQAIFKRWFIDFEFPNENGDPYKSSGGEMVESELGMIPKGWRIATIDELFNISGGSTPNTKNHSYWDGNIFWATPKDMSDLNSPILLETSRKITPSGLMAIGNKLYQKDTIFLSSRAPIGYLCISKIDSAVNQGIIAINTKGKMSNLLILIWCELNLDTITNNANGSTFLEINKKNFRKIRIIAPDEEISKDFDRLLIPLYDLIYKNSLENKYLAIIRDLLLPKLMTGKIRVPLED